MNELYEATLRAKVKEMNPTRQAEHWHPTPGELALMAFIQELRKPRERD